MYASQWGKKFFYPHAACVHITKTPFYYDNLSEEQKDWLTAYQSLFNHLVDVERLLITVQEENKRLKYENEFMLKLINVKEE